MNITMKFDKRFERAMKEAPVQMNKAIVRGLNRSSEIIAKAAVLNITKNKSMVTNALRVAMSGGWRVDKQMLLATIGPTMARRSGQRVNYGFYVERGRGAGKMPPRGSLKQFLLKKVPGVTADNVDQREFGLRLAIAARGTKHTAKPFLMPAFEQSRGAIKLAFERELQKALDEMGEK